MKLHPEGLRAEAHSLVEAAGAADRRKSTFPAAPIARIDGYVVMHKAARILSFQPHMHIRGKRQCLELIYPTGGSSAKTEMINCTNFNYNWHLNYTYTDDVAPLIPAGTILHVITWHDNSQANTSQPRPEELGRRRSADDRRNGLRVDRLVRPDRRRVQGRSSTRARRSAQKKATRRSSNSSSSSSSTSRETCRRHCRRHVSRRQQSARHLASNQRKVPMVLHSVGGHGVGLVWASACCRRQRAENEVNNNFKYNSGQDVQPVFEGWSRNADGSFNMHFGYLNRNWVQELSIPVGPNNSIEPGGPDRGQPTFFYTRTQRNLFTVVVPKDFGKKEVIWTLTVNGKTAEGLSAGCSRNGKSIRPAAPPPAARPIPELKGNKPPTITVDAASTIAVGQTMPLNVDGDRRWHPEAGGGQEAGGRTGDAARTRSRATTRRSTSRSSRRPERRDAPAAAGAVRGPFVTWMVYRGPASADVRIAQHPGEGRQGADLGRLQRPRRIRAARPRQRPRYCSSTRTSRSRSPAEHSSASSGCAQPRLRHLLLAASAALGITGVATRDPLPPEHHDRRPSRSSSTRTASSPRTPARPAIRASTTSWHASYHRTMTQVATPDTAVADFDDVTIAAVHGRPMRAAAAAASSSGPSSTIRTRPSRRTQRPRIERQVTMITGSHNQQIYWYATGSSRLLGQLPGAYLVARAALDSAPHGGAPSADAAAASPRPATGTAPVSPVTRHTASRSSTRRSARSRSTRRSVHDHGGGVRHRLRIVSRSERRARRARIAIRCAATGCT